MAVESAITYIPVLKLHLLACAPVRCNQIVIELRLITFFLTISGMKVQSGKAHRLEIAAWVV